MQSLFFVISKVPVLDFGRADTGGCDGRLLRGPARGTRTGGGYVVAIIQRILVGFIHFRRRTGQYDGGMKAYMLQEERGVQVANDRMSSLL